MAQQKQGFIARLLEGKEKSEEYARSTLPTNRWQLFWDIFKGNFGKMVKVNLLIIIFFIPLLLVLIMGSMLSNNYGLLYPFGSNLGVGYPAVPNQQGLVEMLTLQTDAVTYGLVVLTSVIAAVGLAGGMYVVRNMVWTEGIFVANDFWKGVKLNFKNALQTALLFSVVFFIVNTTSNMTALARASGTLGTAEGVLLTISQVLSYVLLVLVGMMSLWMIALGVNYEQKFTVLLKNAFLIAVGTFPQTIFFGAIAIAPFLLFLIPGEFFIVAACIVVILFGFSFGLLVWLDFAQWVFDKYINPKIAGAKVGRGIYGKGGVSTVEGGGESAASIEYQRVILAAGKSQLVARPIKPLDDDVEIYELPTAFTREDLKRLRASKQFVAEDTEAYVEAHKNDARYVEYNKQFEERERALQEEESKKKKKRKPPKLLGS